MTKSFASSRASIPVRSFIGGFVWSRTRAPAGILKTETTGLRSQSSRASAVFHPAAVPKISDGKARGSEHILNPDAARLGPFIQRGSHWICNLLPAQVAAGKRFSFRNPRVQDSSQAPRGIFQAFSLSPVPFVASLHVGSMEQKDARNHGQITRKHG